jgi:hypothetical protein
MFVVGTSDESNRAATAEVDGATGGREDVAVGGVAGRVGTTFGAVEVGDATSPPLAFRSAALLFPFVVATARRESGDFRPASEAVERSSDAFKIQPSRVTLTHPLGALAPLTATLVPALSDATLRADAVPFDRTTAARLPMRGDVDPRCAEIRERSTKPSRETLAYAPRVSISRTVTPGCTLPMDLPFGVLKTATGVVTTRD